MQSLNKLSHGAIFYSFFFNFDLDHVKNLAFNAMQQQHILFSSINVVITVLLNTSTILQYFDLNLQ